MGKRGSVIFWVSAILVVLLVLVIFLYFALFRQSSSYSGATLKNPVEGLNDSQALAAFDESFVQYLLYSIKAYNLHNVPLSSNYPRMEIDVEGEIFNANVRKGAISVTRGEIANEDVVIRTTGEEAIKMLRDRDYVARSFSESKSVIELVADKTTLFAKGYLTMYNELTGKSITGDIIRISTD